MLGFVPTDTQSVVVPNLDSAGVLNEKGPWRAQTHHRKKKSTQNLKVKGNESMTIETSA